ncbi:MAG: hypothetical protein J1E84_02590 [Muribaculaceae bacterium]|nr:hypothetical protein [Muribaculaceae bacterium]
MTKKFFKCDFVGIMLLILCFGFIATSCSEDEPPTTGNIVGTWVSVETETQSNGVTITTTITMNFSSNGSGYRKIENIFSTGASTSSMYTFKYTVATQSSGVLRVTTVDDDDNNKETYDITQTGNTLMIGSRIYTRQ